MVSHKKKWITAASVGVLVAGGWLTYSLMAKQGQGVLSQMPLNIQASVPPSFLMALDDSGSMLWEVQNTTRDGVFRWVRNADRGTIGFYNGTRAYGFDEGTGTNYHYLTPNYGRDGNYAIPPVDAYGFARSPDFNPAYFDPREVYPDWKNGDDDPLKSSYMTIDPLNAPVDPRPAGASGKSNLVKNLTVMELSTADNMRFRFSPNMVIPANTLIRTRGCNTDDTNTSAFLQDGTATPSGFVRATVDIRVTNTCDMNVGYFPATFYLATPMPASYGYTATPVAITNPAGGRPGTIYKYQITLDNFGGDETAYKLALNNFANWFSFYRTRREALIGAATNALQETENLRVGWFRINNRRQATMYDMWDTAQKKALLADITKDMRASDSTPNRSAAAYLGSQFKRVKSSSDPLPPVRLSCQKNAGMLFTDGFINETGNTTRMRDGIAQYYDNSLVPTLESNSVPVPKGCPDGKLDCKSSLHMNFYGVTLGTLGEQFGVTYLPDPETPWVLTPNPYDTPPKFGTKTVDLAPGAVDELWEAVLYTHGEMVNANKASDITSAMRRIISNVSKGATPSGTRSLTGARIGKGSLAVEPFYEAKGTDWYSTLTAYNLSVDPTTRAIVSSEAWEASKRIPAPGARNVWMWKDGAVQQFSANTVTLGDLCSKPTGLYTNMKRCSTMEALAGDADTAVSYLLGETAKEVRVGGNLRDRTTVLGDIINSTPVVSSPTDDYGYRNLGTIGASYVEYLETKRKERRYMVYAGANDGMLHAFDGGMAVDGIQDGNGGRELFGYIPATALGHMGNLLVPETATALSDNTFEHRYFVDGPVVVSDIHDSTWKTALVGTMGAGGRGVFAMDVSDPTGFGKNSLMWELSDLNTGLDSAVLDNIGFVLGKPVIVPVKSGSGTAFKAIFGNGVESKNGKAALFVVSMEAGKKPSVATYVVEEQGSNLPAGSNGLTNIVVVDRWKGADQKDSGRDGLADTVYAADQKGAIWKFDLTSDKSPTVPVFTTKTSVDADTKTYRQPIMGGLTATSGAAGGVMLFFGTGSFSFTEDGPDKTVQGLYGVNDVSGKEVTTTLTAANLRPITVSAGTDSRTVTMGAIPTDYAGWTVILPPGERFIANPAVSAGVVFMPTYMPKEGEAVGCAVDGSNWLFGLNTNSGASALSQVRVGTPDGKSPAAGTAALPLNTGGNAPVKDVTTAVVPRLGAPEKTGANPPPTPPGSACMMQVSVAGAPPMYLPYPCGRQSWRQIK